MDDELISPNGEHAKIVFAKSRRPSNFWLIIVAALFIVVPFLTWYFTWFGRNLSDEDIAAYLSDEKNPRHIQHALLQVEQKIERGDPSAKKFYPQVVAAGKSPEGEVRKTAAWVMGQDNKSEEFHRALDDLLKDDEPLVRRNAALQLVRFNDASGRPELRAMLQKFEAKSPIGGTIISLLPQGSDVRAGAMLARLRDAAGNAQEFRAPIDGRVSPPPLVKEGDPIAAGQTVVWLTPDRTTIIDALRALSYIGTKEDLTAVESAAQIDASAETSAEVAQAIKTIRNRSQ